MIKLSIQEILEELTAQELSYGQGSDGALIDSKAEDVKFSVLPLQYDEDSGTIRFKISSISRSGMQHNTLFQMVNMYDIKTEIKNLINEGKFMMENLSTFVSRAILGNIKLHCTCESYQYYRSYQLSQLDAAVYPETRPPKKTDRNLQRVHLCHHLLATIRYVLKDVSRMTDFIIANDNFLGNIKETNQNEEI